MVSSRHGLLLATGELEAWHGWGPESHSLWTAFEDTLDPELGSTDAFLLSEALERALSFSLS